MTASKNSRKLRNGSSGLFALIFATGCYTTTVTSGRAPGPAEPKVKNEEVWHSGLILGVAELSGPHELEALCPNGWAEIITETSFLNGLVEWATSGIYTPQTVTVVCAGGPGPAAAATQTPGE